MSETAINAEKRTVRNACGAWTWRMEPHCGACGYDLRGSPEPRCPECGVAYEPVCPVCGGDGQLGRRRSAIPSLLLFLSLTPASVVLFQFLAPSFVRAFNSKTASEAFLIVASGVFVLLAVMVWGVTKASSGECRRCLGTGIDYQDRIRMDRKE